MNFIFGFLLVDIGIVIGIALMCMITLSGGCYEGCLMRKAAGIKEDGCNEEGQVCSSIKRPGRFG